MKFRTPFDTPLRVTSPTGEVSATDQSFADECNINVIVKRAARTGTLPIVQSNLQFGEMDERSLHEAMTMVVQAKEAFEALPASLRERFANSPERLLAFLDDPANLDEAVKLGLASPPPPAPEPASPSTAESVATKED